MDSPFDLLFEPLRVGNVTLRNRMMLAPLTRQRSHMNGVPSDLNVLYYKQRASAGLIVTEGTYPSVTGQGYLFEAGLCNEAHVAGWRRVTDAVHAEGGAIFCQLMHVGRLTDELMLDGREAVAPSAVQPDPAASYPRCPRAERPFGVPHALTTSEVQGVIEDYKHATELAVRAGFDGVEIHGANGYLPIQFLSTNTNLRTDEFGGSVEKRSNFILSLVDAMATVAGPGYVAVKLGPGSTSQGVFDADPHATYTYLVPQLSKRGIAYLQLQPGGKLTFDLYPTLRPLFDGPMAAVRGLTRTTAAEVLAGGTADLVAFGQTFLANPDLVERFRNGWPLNVPDLPTFYSQGAAGYTDYPTYAQGDPATMVPTDSRPPRRDWGNQQPEPVQVRQT
jgi:N-ethylmaleimide reductase